MSEQTATPLNNLNLHRLQKAVQVPTYDRKQLLQHTVHIGVGGFHRAHQAVYLDDLLGIPYAEPWGECGLAVLASDHRMRDALSGQDFLYTVAERSASGQSARVVGSLVDYIYAPGNREAAIERLADPATRIVSLTITEGGYFIDEDSGAFLRDHPAIQHDLLHASAPESSLGFLAAALDRRRRRGLPPFTVMSCDNLQGNGHVIRKVLLAFASLSNPELERWIAGNVAFPNSMVDRITPSTTPADIVWLRSRFGIEDAWPVVTEPFRQWVIEDSFSNGRPRWERVGAEFTTDVAPYEAMKMRLLNGSHLAMAYLSALHGFSLVQDTMADPLFRSFVASFMEEVTPAVPQISGISVAQYKKTLLERFANPTINDQITRICSEGSAKIPKWLLPSIQALLASGHSVRLLSLVVASWIFYLASGVDEQGEALEIIDARRSELSRLAASRGVDPTPLLSARSLFGEHLSANKVFVAGVESALNSLATMGVAATLRQYAAGT